jgi:hypothetical protein
MDGLDPSIQANGASRGFMLSAARLTSAWVAGTDPQIKSRDGHDALESWSMKQRAPLAQQP